jgi:lipid-binding SYLF domain-containing protein
MAIRRLTACTAILGISLLGSCSAARAQLQRSEPEVLAGATAMLQSFAFEPGNGPPRAVLQKAFGIAVIPYYLRAGFIFGGSGGRGVVMVRSGDQGWSQPIMIQAAGGSFGAQIGVESTGLLLVFTTPNGVQRFMNGSGKFRIGADLSASAGPVGRGVGAGTDLKFQSEILTYARSRGLFAGATVEGMNMAMDWQGTAALYGKLVRPADVWNSKEKLPAPPYVAALVAQMNQLTGAPVAGDAPAGGVVVGDGDGVIVDDGVFGPPSQP